MKTFVTILSGFIGTAIGLLLGTVGFYYVCVGYDMIHYPNGVPAGGGLIAVGWIFIPFTVPAGMLGGGFLGAFLIRKWLYPKKKTPPPLPPSIP